MCPIWHSIQMNILKKRTCKLFVQFKQKINDFCKLLFPRFYSSLLLTCQSSSTCCVLRWYVLSASEQHCSWLLLYVFVLMCEQHCSWLLLYVFVLLAISLFSTRSVLLFVYCCKTVFSVRMCLNCSIWRNYASGSGKFSVECKTQLNRQCLRRCTGNGLNRVHTRQTFSANMKLQIFMSSCISRPRREDHTLVTCHVSRIVTDRQIDRQAF
jgi:hypothetical protein